MAETKQARKKLPLNKRKKAVLYVMALVLWVGASVIFSQLLIGYLMIFLLGRETFSQPVPLAIYSALSYILATVLVIIVPPKILKRRKIRKADREELGLRGLPTWTDVGLAPVGFVVYLVIAALLVTLFSLFPWFDAGEAQDVGFSVYLTGMNRFIAFIVLVVVAPIFEEVIFRGWLYGKLREKMSEELSNAWSIILPMLTVSLLFGAVHLQWNVGVNVFAMSLVLCGLREVTGTIYAGILMHMIKNGLAFYLLYILGM